jgi:DNA-directed RNA polymerase specialized sigma subunit
MRDAELKITGVSADQAEVADDLDAHVRERSEGNPRLPALIRAAERRRALAREMVKLRHQQEKSQTVIGAAIGTSQSAIARLESGDADTRFSTLERYAAGLGYEIEYRLIPSPK